MDPSFYLLPKLPSLNTCKSDKTSERDDKYNCIAWAAGDSTRWWWPEHYGYWPKGVPRERTMAAFIAAFGTLGYTACDDGTFEIGYEKVVIYATAEGPSHAARQLDNGHWTSKLGPCEDIYHETEAAVHCNDYGEVAQYLRRPKIKV